MSIKLPNLNDPAWGWKDENGLTATGVLPHWNITIRCGWIEIFFYPTDHSCVIASFCFPAPEDNKQAKQIAEESVHWIKDKLYTVALLSKEVALRLNP